MLQASSSKSCSPCRKRRSYSWMPAILVAILPKCPFCIMAYSGAITMCSGNMYPNIGGWSSYLTMGLAIMVIIGILFNYKGTKSLIAASISLIGIAFLVSSQFYSIGQTNYYIGVFFIFFGIWFNGSFFYFYHRYFNSKANSYI